ncbi:MAG TPA: hypothetical protein VII72_22210 [Myxococcota bacterium]
MTVRSRACAGGLLAGVLLASAAQGAGEIRPGAYCPFPKPGEKPACLVPAKQAYGEFFAALDENGDVGEAASARLEADVAAGAGSQNAYLALSSLAYGYYRLSQQAAASPNEDPQVVARLERWNALLASAYAASPQDAKFQDSVREAALDLQRRAPPVELSCLDESGGPVRCDSTEAVVRDIDRLRDEVGVRGALSRLLGRFFDDGAEPAR